MISETALKLFQDNYSKKGLCADLPKYLKVFNKEYKKSNTVREITYYPWAVVERFFRMQGGQVEVVEWATRVAFPYMDYTPNADGELVMTNQEQYALFIHLKATWQGLEEHEYYPIFDNQNSKIIKTPNALDLNKARQRGMVRLIARISGIGLDIFEQTDSQEEEAIEELAETTAIKVEKKIYEPKVEVAKPKPKVAPEPEAQPEPQDFMQSFLSGDSVKPAVAPEPKSSEYGNDTQEYADLLLEIRKSIRENGSQTVAKQYVQELEKELLSDLTYGELIQLKEKI
jgi:hypothetical protein